MIIFGTGSKTLGKTKLPFENCPNCDAVDLHLRCVAKYFHLFWIPMFPTDKRAFIKCHSCSVDPKITNQKTLDKIKKEKTKFSYPLYLFAGTAALLLLIGYLSFDSYQHDKEVAKNIKNLQSTDVIVFRGNGIYNFGLVREVREDTIFLNLSNYMFNDVPNEEDYLTEKDKVDDFYNPELYFYRQDQIDSLYNEGDVFDLYRKNNE